MEESQVGTEQEVIQDDPAQPEATGVTPQPTEAVKAEPQQEEAFFDPNALPEELKPVWKKMQGAYTKKMQGIAEDKKLAGVVRRFDTDPQFAISTIQQKAAQLGYSISKAQAADIAQGQAAMPGAINAPDSLVQLIKSRLSPELQFMANDLANSSWAVQQAMLAPIQQKQQEDDKARRETEYEDHVAKLSERYPGWEAHEEEMDRIMEFMESPKLNHPVYGSKMELLYKLATGNGAAIAEAATRMGSAARNRVNSGVINRQSMPNISDRVRKAPTMNEAWEIAKEAARQLSKAE